jgi:bifunctional UDP-N-acetylglucosamine pyrophosphorylase/glucosamine-1-phosphate N-acetyltransferase
MVDDQAGRQTQGLQATGRQTAAIILAAGRSTRMKTELPKVMHEICGRPMLSYVLDACREARITTLHLVVGFAKETVIQAFSHDPDVRFVEQREQKGTGHAVMVCAEAFKGFSGDVVVIAGDMPTIRSQTLQQLLATHRSAAAAASIATTVLAEPKGYGRIIRGSDGRFERIVEHRDCTPEQLTIHEVNPSYYCFDSQALFTALPKLRADNAKGEYYITDTLAVIREGGGLVQAAVSVPAEDAVGINSRAELADVAKVMQRRIQADWMERGVTIVDPGNTWIDSRVRIGAETVIKPFTCVEGFARVGAGCVVGPFACIEDGSVIEDGSRVGPGVLRALDATGGGRTSRESETKRNAQCVRRPPAQTGCGEVRTRE